MVVASVLLVSSFYLFSRLFISSCSFSFVVYICSSCFFACRYHVITGDIFGGVVCALLFHDYHLLRASFEPPFMQLEHWFDSCQVRACAKTAYWASRTGYNVPRPYVCARTTVCLPALSWCRSADAPLESCVRAAPTGPRGGGRRDAALGCLPSAGESGGHRQPHSRDWSRTGTPRLGSQSAAPPFRPPVPLLQARADTRGHAPTGRGRGQPRPVRPTPPHGQPRGGCPRPSAVPNLGVLLWAHWGVRGGGRCSGPSQGGRRVSCPRRATPPPPPPPHANRARGGPRRHQSASLATRRSATRRISSCRLRSRRAVGAGPPPPGSIGGRRAAVARPCTVSDVTLSELQRNGGGGGAAKVL